MKNIREIYNDLKDIDISQNQDAANALSVRLEVIADHLRANGDIKWAEHFDDLANVVERNARNVALVLTPGRRNLGNFREQR